MHVSCQNRGPNVPPPARPKDPNLYDLNQMSGSIDGEEWSLKVGDSISFTSNGIKYITIRLSDSATIKACSKDAKTAFEDRRVYITVPAKVANTNIGANQGVVAFQYYHKEDSFLYNKLQGTVKITKITNELVEGSLVADGEGQNVNGTFSVARCN